MSHLPKSPFYTLAAALIATLLTSAAVYAEDRSASDMSVDVTATTPDLAPPAVPTTAGVTSQTSSHTTHYSEKTATTPNGHVTATHSLERTTGAVSTADDMTVDDDE